MVWEVRNGGADTNGGGFRGGANLATPPAPVVTPSASGGTVTAGTYYVVVTLTDGNGETPKSAQTAVTTSGGTASFTVTAPTDPGVQGSTWNVYVGTASGGPYFSQGTGLAFGANRVVTVTPPTSGTQAPGVDYSQQNAAQVVIDNAAVTATTTGANSNTLTFTGGYTPTAADVGNTVRLTGGTNITVGTYEITGWTATTWTLAGAANATGAGGAGAAVTGNMGGALATPGMAAGLLTGGNTVFVKYNASAYVCSASSNVAGGKVDSGTQAAWVGYNTTRDINNLDASRPTLQAGANSMTVFRLSAGAGAMAANLILDGNAHTSVTGLDVAGAGGCARNCKATGCATGINGTANNVSLHYCEGTACTTEQIKVTNGGSCYGCVAHASASNGNGFSVAGGAQGTNFVGCVAAALGSGTGFVLGGFASASGCVAYSCTTGYSNSNGRTVAANCLAHTCTTGFSSTVAAYSPGNFLVNCAAYACTTPYSLGTHGAAASFIALTADPFANTAGNDFSLNTTAGGGAALRAAGYPSSFPGLSTASYPDVGAAQHADPAAPVSTDPGVANVKAGTIYTINGASLTGTLAAAGQSRGQAGRRSFG